MVGSVARLAGQLVHVRAPSRGVDSHNGGRVDVYHAVFPLVRWLVYDVGLAVGADLGLDAVLLLEKHAALHCSAALVILDVVHLTSYACRSTISSNLSLCISIHLPSLQNPFLVRVPWQTLSPADDIRRTLREHLTV